MSYEFYSDVLEKDVLYPSQGGFAPITTIQVLHARDLDAGATKFRPAVGTWQNLMHEKPATVTPGAPRAARLSRYATGLQGSMAVMDELGLLRPNLRLVSVLPPYSGILSVAFTLVRPIFTRDDEVFYPAPNPVRKERLWGVPMLAGSSWKGALRAAAVDLLRRSNQTNEQKSEQRKKLIAIFGDEKGAGEPGRDAEFGSMAWYLDQKMGAGDRQPSREGRVHFLASYFNRVDIDVLNPRNRETRAGTDPIMMEIVPAGTKGVLTLVYVPFDLLDQSADVRLAAVTSDWALIGEAIAHMLRKTGVGAKKSIQYGRVSRTVTVEFETSVPNADALSGPCSIEALTQLGTCFGGQR